MNDFCVPADTHGVFVDGSAVVEKNPSLGTGRIRVFNDAVVDRGSKRIYEFPRFSSKLSLFAEFVAARRGIRSAPLDGKVMIYSDHDFIVNFINDPEITKGMIRKHPEILEEWKLLQRAIKQYASGSVTAVLVDGDSNDYSKAAHNLACAASGSRDRFAGDFPLILDSQSHARLALQRT